MKVSELISQLQALQEKYGEVPVEIIVDGWSSEINVVQLDRYIGTSEQKVILSAT